MRILFIKSNSITKISANWLSYNSETADVTVIFSNKYTLANFRMECNVAIIFAFFFYQKAGNFLVATII